MDEQTQEKLTIPWAIVAAGVIVALAIIYTGGKKSPAELGRVTASGGTSANGQRLSQQKLAENVRPVSPTDHILGNPNAPIKIVEYSDIQCPFCRQFHPVMLQIMDSYGKQGKVAWVYRHFPLTAIHPLAMPAALASECVFQQGGNDKFWAYVDKLFADGLTSQTQLSDTAKALGLDPGAFKTCLDGAKAKAVVDGDIQNGLEAGVSGTPYSIILDKDGKVLTPLAGAAPYTQIQAIIDAALAK